MRQRESGRKGWFSVYVWGEFSLHSRPLITSQTTLSLDSSVRSSHRFLFLAHLERENGNSPSRSRSRGKGKGKGEGVGLGCCIPRSDRLWFVLIRIIMKRTWLRAMRGCRGRRERWALRGALQT